MLSKKQKTLAAAIGATLVLTLAAACDSAEASSTPTTETVVACSDVDSQLSEANQRLTSAQAKVEDVKGTPDEEKVNGEIAAAQAEVDDLNARKTSCEQEASASAASSSTASPTTAPTPADTCPGSYVVKLDANAGANLFSQGLSPDSETMRQQVLDGAKADPRVLQVYYNASPLGQASPIQATTDIAPITDGACFTAAGKAAYDQWVVLWKVTKLSGDTLPEQGTNTGAEPGGSAFQETGLIPAGTGMKVVYVDANGNEIGSHKVRLECGNVVTTSPIALPGRPESVPPIVSPPPAPPAPPAETTEVPPPGTTPPPSPLQKCEWPTPYGDFPLCKDSPDVIVFNNPDVQAGVKGNGSNPPGQTAGAASPVTDSPSGCRGTCSNAATATAAPANPSQTQRPLPSDPPEVQNPNTGVASIPASAGATGVAGGGCQLDPYGNPIGDC